MVAPRSIVIIIVWSFRTNHSNGLWKRKWVEQINWTSWKTYSTECQICARAIERGNIYIHAWKNIFGKTVKSVQFFIAYTYISFEITCVFKCPHIWKKYLCFGNIAILIHIAKIASLYNILIASIEAHLSRQFTAKYRDEWKQHWIRPEHWCRLPAQSRLVCITKGVHCEGAHSWYGMELAISHSARRPRTLSGRSSLGPYEHFPDVLICRGCRKYATSTSSPRRTYELRYTEAGT